MMLQNPPVTGRYRREWDVGQVGIGQWGSRWACAAAVILFLRDGLAGLVRFYLDSYHASLLWFAPDLVAAIGFVLFVQGPLLRLQSPLALLIVVQFCLSLAIGIVFMTSPPLAIISSIKLFVPFALGYAMAGQSFTDERWKRIAILAILAISVAGLLMAPFVNFPWVGAEFQSLGVTRVANRQWWSDSLTQRHGGFAYDNTSAAFLCVFLYAVIYTHLPARWRLLLIGPISVALWFSNSKTAILTWLMYLAYLLFMRQVRADRSQNWSVRLARLSFLFVPIPVLLMLSVSGLDLSDISTQLVSVQDRINNTWQFPFLYLSRENPLLLLTGCGLGCFTYPMFYTPLTALNVPLDNYYLTSMVTFGGSFLIIILGMLWRGTRSVSAEKLVLILLFNIYSVTVQCFGPASTGFLLAYAFSDMFLPTDRPWRRGQLGRLLPGMTEPKAGRTGGWTRRGAGEAQ